MRGFVARKTPAGSWRVQMTIGGSRISITRPTKKEAEQEALRRYAEAERAGVRRVSGQDRTIGDLVDKYIALHRPVSSPSTIRGYAAIRKKRFPELMELRFRDVRDWQLYVSMEAERVAPKTLKNAWSLIHSAVTSEGYIVPPVRLAPLVPLDYVFLDDKQIPIFLDAVRGDPCEIALLLALQSLRRSELCALRWSQFELDAKPHPLIHVAGAFVQDDQNRFSRQEQNKNRASHRIIPVFIVRLEELLRAEAPLHDPDEYVVKIHPNNVLEAVKRTVKKDPRLPQDLTLHDLRRSFCSLCYVLGIDELTTMQLGGWSDYATMRRVYTILSQRHLGAAYDRLAAFFAKKEDRPGGKS